MGVQLALVQVSSDDTAGVGLADGSAGSHGAHALEFERTNALLCLGEDLFPGHENEIWHACAAALR